MLEGVGLVQGVEALGVDARRVLGEEGFAGDGVVVVHDGGRFDVLYCRGTVAGISKESGWEKIGRDQGSAYDKVVKMDRFRDYEAGQAL